MHSLFTDLTKLVFDIIFPSYCFNCNREGAFLCSTCVIQIRPNIPQQCIACHKPNYLGLTHEQCQTANMPLQTFMPYDYHDTLLSNAIISGKYKFLPSVFKILATSATATIKDAVAHGHDEIILCPVPLFSSRMRWRGFNQAKIICDTLSQSTGWPTQNLLKRQKNTATQKDLDRKQRLQNVTNCFTPIAVTVNPNAMIILVDDVITTGATMREAVKTIRQHYSNPITCLALASD